MHSAPLCSNPLSGRSDVIAALGELWRPIRPLVEEKGAETRFGVTQGFYGEPGSCLECLARPLWGIAALTAGKSTFADWDMLREALLAGVNPAHDQYWGKAEDQSQYMVEMASISVALILAQRELWAPMDRTGRRNLVAWLSVINRRGVVDNNWLFFRVLVNLALEDLGEECDLERLNADLNRLEEFYLDDGWYGDGEKGSRDYYVPMAFHFYGLLYSRLRGNRDPDRSARFRDRADRFGPRFASWFSADGSAIPFGRSLTYRFAQGCFWGACAFADLEVLPWGVMKGLYLRHLRWWLKQPIFTETGLLTIGYRYPNLIAADNYNAPGSPYWAFKAFLPLALPEDHPFWAAEELPWKGAESVVEPAVPMLIGRDQARDHVFGISGHSSPAWNPRFGAQKYAKFAYSTAFGFGVPVGGVGPDAGGGDSMLLVTDDDHDWRGRNVNQESRIIGQTLYSRWSPWPDVEVETWLALALPGHVRVHRLRSARAVRTFEGGFALNRLRQGSVSSKATGGRVYLANQHGFSGLMDPGGIRVGEILSPQPNTNLLWPLVSLPGLTGHHEAGEHWLVSIVAGLPGENQYEAGVAFVESFTVDGTVVRRDGIVVMECSRS